ncbi:hypothetical protein QBC47DRAFT_353319 [Echria macrotheca]|uniref:SET domain-containing protein n=1 Tax=Echria macrotheca TaxID=438768 RepID=A0AAJ0B2A8_9PEZI|nr:hypothetical protein QBC47DRAFT_353319 [Echria macrotheca]
MQRLGSVSLLFAYLFVTETWAKEDQCLQRPPILDSQQSCPLAAPEKKWEFKDEKWDWKSKKPAAWDGPYDCINEYCTFVNPTLDGGMVLISAERNIDVIDRFSKKKLFKHDAPPYYATQIPGKGIGLVANRTIEKGEIIMNTLPSLLVQFSPHLDLDGETRLELYKRAAKRLPPHKYEFFMRQYGPDEYTKIDRNSFRVFLTGDRNKFSGHLADYLEVAQLNHDCRPNIHYRIDNITHISHAVRPIQPGEELTISYIDGHHPHAKRQQLLSNWGFKCDCPHCNMPRAEIAASDARLGRIAAIEEDIKKMLSGEREIDVQLGDELVGLYRDEKFEIYIGQAYARAALLHSLVGDVEGTEVLAGMAADALAVEFGEEHEDTRGMRLLAGDREGHWSWDGVRRFEEMMREDGRDEDREDLKR